MRAVLEDRFRKAEGSIEAALYCIDDAEIVRILSKKAVSGVSVRLVLDESQVKEPSCSMQHQKMIELLEWGVVLHKLKAGSGFAILHHKMWIVDGETFFSGSVNPTHNGLTNNVEHLLEIKGAEAVNAALVHLNELFERSTLITKAFVSERVYMRLERRERQEQQRRSASASAKRG